MRLHDHATESALLGLVSSMSLRSPALARDMTAGLALAADDFAHPSHAALWRVSTALLARGQPFEAVGARAEGLAQGATIPPQDLLDVFLDGSAYMESELATLAREVRQLATRRRLVDAAHRLAAAAKDPTLAPDVAALEASNALATLGSSGAEALGTLQDDVLAYVDRLDAIAQGRVVACIPSGIDVWDDLLGGLQAGVVTFIGAQPSVGKSALVGAMIRNVARAGHVVGLFSLEDAPEWLAERAISYESRVPVHRLATARLHAGEDGDVQDAAASVHGWAARVVRDGRSGLTAQQVAATARQMVAQRGAKAIFVDHLGEIDVQRGKHDRHDLAVADAVRQLRDVAKDMGVPVVVCAHFARPTKSDREPRYIRPSSSSWANSAGVERMARVAVGLWLAEDSEGEVIATVLKQTRGDKDFDFAMPLHRASGLIRNEGGRRREKQQGHHEDERQKPRKGEA